MVKIFKINFIYSQSGAVAIIALVIISAVALLIVKETAWLGLAEMEIGWQSVKGQEAMHLAEGCAEEIIRRYQLDADYTASDYNLTMGNGGCVINTSANDDERIITATGQVDNYYKAIRVNITVASGTPININSWEEMQEFD